MLAGATPTAPGTRCADAQPWSPSPAQESAAGSRARAVTSPARAVPAPVIPSTLRRRRGSAGKGVAHADRSRARHAAAHVWAIAARALCCRYRWMGALPAWKAQSALRVRRILLGGGGKRRGNRYWQEARTRGRYWSPRSAVRRIRGGPARRHGLPCRPGLPPVLATVPRLGPAGMEPTCHVTWLRRGPGTLLAQTWQSRSLVAWLSPPGSGYSSARTSPSCARVSCASSRAAGSR